MNKTYKDYSPEELMDDRGFISWILHGTNRDEWELFLQEHPEFSETVTRAKELIAALDPGDELLPGPEAVQIWKTIETFHEESNRRKGKKIRTAWFIRIAATFLLLTTSGIIAIWIMNRDTEPYRFVTDESQIESGDARLVLSTGENIRLKNENSKITVEEGKALYIENDSTVTLGNEMTGTGEKDAMNEVIVPFGKKSRILLSDGTKVWLNAGSRFAFPSGFTGKNREVFLEGEAYFEVSKSDRSFFVNTPDLKVKVFGTRFNVSAYKSDKQVETILLEGKVSVSANTAFGLMNREIILEPFQKASYIKETHETLITPEPEADIYISWTEGWFHFSKTDGITWQKPRLGQVGATNMVQLFGFHSPSFILDTFETDPAKRYKAIGSKDGFSKEVIDRLKAKFNSPEWYTRRYAYCAATSPDGLRWEMVPDPILLGMDTITLAQDPCTGEYLAFHKQTQDPRSFGRQVFLSTSKDILSWTYPELAMATDETDHQEARKLEGGTHAEIYNMSAFYHAGQWLGLATIFKCTGEPLVNGKARAGQKGIIDVQLVHSRDGRRWSRCSDRSPVIPAGPSDYDKGMVFGVCNTPVFVGDEMWMYYSASNDVHYGDSPGKKASIGLATWRLDGMVSLQAEEKEGIVETTSFTPEGNTLSVNVRLPDGVLKTEVLNGDGTPIPGYRKEECMPVKGSGVSQPVSWKKSKILPERKPIRLRFFLSGGNLYSYTIQ